MLWIKILGIIFSAVLVASVIFIYAFKQNMFNIRSLFKTRQKGFFKVKKLTEMISFIEDFGGLGNIKSVRNYKGKLIVDVIETKIVKPNSYKLNEKSYFVTLESEFLVNERLELISYALK